MPFHFGHDIFARSRTHSLSNLDVRDQFKFLIEINVILIKLIIRVMLNAVI